MTLQSTRAIFFRVAFAGLALSMSAACGRGEPSTDAERLARGRELVQQMSDRLGAATRLRVTTTEMRDVVRLSGARESVTGAGEYTVQRPDRFHAKTAAGRNLESWYNGKVLTIASHNEKVFGQAPMPETINRTLDALAERYDMALPMGDLFYGPASKALLSETVTGGYVGTEDVGGTRCFHLAFKDLGADFELWLPMQGEPLPKRFKVVQKGRTGQPVIDVTFNEWNLAPQINDATFKPTLPADYEGIALVQRAAAIKNTAASEAAPAQK
jgi:hypothetical protein